MKAKGKWSNEFGIAVFRTPNNKEVRFDYRSLDTEALKFYGFKQWLSDSVSDIPDYTEKTKTMKERFDEALKSGLELVEGRISIKGKVRANASPDREASRKAISLVSLLVKEKTEGLTSEEETLKETLLQAAIEVASKKVDSLGKEIFNLHKEEE